jgi:hypothetical protein
MPTSINFDKKLGFINGTSIVLPSGSGADFSTRSLFFDGIDDYVEVADADNLSFGNGVTDSPFSVSTWWKMDNANGFRGVQKYSSSYEYRINTIGSSGILKCQLYDNSNTIYIGQQSNVGLSIFLQVVMIVMVLILQCTIQHLLLD